MRQQGFSLVELSIVLVILGLLTGGILAGQSLIRAAEMRKIVTTQNRVRIAIRTFQDKYTGLPGDFRDATRFWRTRGPTSCLTNSGTAVGLPGTCDGDGDGKIFWTTTNSIENNRVFEHLRYAGLVEGNMYHCPASCPADYTDDTPYLPIGMENGYVSVGYIGVINGTNMSLTNIHGNAEMNVIRIGAPTATTSNYFGGIASLDETWNIDTKLDDGLPGRGKILIMYNPSDPAVVPVRCVNAFNSPTAAYNLQFTEKTCMFHFVL